MEPVPVYDKSMKSFIDNFALHVNIWIFSRKQTQTVNYRQRISVNCVVSLISFQLTLVLPRLIQYIRWIFIINIPIAYQGLSVNTYPI